MLLWPVGSTLTLPASVRSAPSEAARPLASDSCGWMNSACRASGGPSRKDDAHAAFALLDALDLVAADIDARGVEELHLRS